MRDSYLALRYFSLAITFLINLSLLNFTLAADVTQIEQVFREQFWQGLYQANRCGQNTENFTRLLLRKNIDVQNLSIVQITNDGGGNYGMVGALRARERGRFISNNPPPGQPEREPGEQNWDYHAFVMADGLVFDFDFENNPRVLELKNYILEMFIPEERRNDSKYIREKLSGYKLSIATLRDEFDFDPYDQRLRGIFEEPVKFDLIDYLKINLY